MQTSRPSVVATSIGHATNGTNTTLAPPEFRLISFDKLGNRTPLPLGLGDLPLYLDDDGYFSVNGPRDLAVFSSHPTIVPINHDNHSSIYPVVANPSGFSSENTRVSPDRRQFNNDDFISRFLLLPETHNSSCTSLLTIS